MDLVAEGLPDAREKPADLFRRVLPPLRLFASGNESAAASAAACGTPFHDQFQLDDRHTRHLLSGNFQ